MRRLSDIHVQRGRLLERITTQRYFLAAEIQPVHVALDKVDAVRARVRLGVDYVKRNPVIAGVAFAVLATMNFRRTVRLAQRGFLLWRTWLAVRQKLLLMGWPRL